MASLWFKGLPPLIHLRIMLIHDDSTPVAPSHGIKRGAREV
jgi:hypothetical protein